MPMARIVLFILAAAFVLAGLAGAWIFLNPETPPLDRIEGGEMAAIDSRTGVYREPEGAERFIAPDLAGGWRMYGTQLPSWAHYDEDGTRTDEPGAIGFTGGGYVRTLEDATSREAVRLDPQPFTLSALEVDRDVALHAWLFAPAGEPDRLVVIVHGSGSSDRRNAYYVLLAQTLARAGAAVVLPDKRGSGRSGGDWRSADFDTLAGDAAAFMQAGQARFPGVEPAFVGVSQGGSIAPLAAQIAGVRDIVILGAAMVPFHEQLRTEISNDVRAEGIADWLNPAVTTAFAARARGRYREFWRRNGHYDTFEALDAWDGRAFIAYGQLDEYDNVPVSRSVARLEARFGEDPDVSWRVYPDVGHALLTPDYRFHPGFVEDLLGFLDLEPQAR